MQDRVARGAAGRFEKHLAANACRLRRRKGIQIARNHAHQHVRHFDLALPRAMRPGATRLFGAGAIAPRLGMQRRRETDIARQRHRRLRGQIRLGRLPAEAAEDASPLAHHISRPPIHALAVLGPSMFENLALRYLRQEPDAEERRRASKPDARVFRQRPVCEMGECDRRDAPAVLHPPRNLGCCLGRLTRERTCLQLRPVDGIGRPLGTPESDDVASCRRAPARMARRARARVVKRPQTVIRFCRGRCRDPVALEQAFSQERVKRSGLRRKRRRRKACGNKRENHATRNHPIIPVS